MGSLFVATYVIAVTEGEFVMFKIKVRKIGNSLGAILPGDVAARLRVKEGGHLFMTETANGIQLSPFDPDFEAVMSAFEQGRKRYRNALRRLSK
jgi:putative addiction module antidote